MVTNLPAIWGGRSTSAARRNRTAAPTVLLSRGDRRTTGTAAVAALPIVRSPTKVLTDIQESE